jgi:L-fuculose-phosphate aldolase
MSLKIRKEIIQTCLEMERLGINQGTSGNISHRYKDGILITPSGVAYDELKPKDIVFVPFKDKSAYDGEYPPSSELDFHFDILYSMPQIDCVLHNHSTYASAVAMCRQEIPPYHYMVAVCGKDRVPCAKYATFGSKELSINIIEVLKEGFNSTLLANHGVVTTAKRLKKALWLAIEIENLAKGYIFAKQAGTPKKLSKAEMNKIIKKFQTYGLKKR